VTVNLPTEQEKSSNLKNREKIFFFAFWVFFFFEERLGYAAQAALKLSILLPQPLKCKCALQRTTWVCHHAYLRGKKLMNRVLGSSGICSIRFDTHVSEISKEKEGGK
jgi:hypothetical protein